MIVYFDTSAIIPILIEEPASANCKRLWQRATRTSSVRLLYVEARSALASAQRTGRLSVPGLANAVGTLGGLVRRLDTVDVSERLVDVAGDIAQDQGLRAYDAVHLAAGLSVANGDRIVFASGDRRLLVAAQRLGLDVAPTVPAPDAT